MIRAAEMDVLGKFDSRLSSVDKISEHTGIPEENIVAMDIDYGGDVSAVTVLVVFACYGDLTTFLLFFEDQLPSSFRCCRP